VAQRTLGARNVISAVRVNATSEVPGGDVDTLEEHHNGHHQNERRPPRNLEDPDHRPIGEADLTNAEARETALFYLKKRQKIEDDIYSTEKEWVHMFSVVGDLGFAMELGAKKETLEAELEGMAEREAEIAEEMVVMRELQKDLRSKTSLLGRLRDEQALIGAGADDMRAELERLKDAVAESEAGLKELQLAELQARTEIASSKTAFEEVLEETNKRKELIATLLPEVEKVRFEQQNQAADKAKADSQLLSLKKEVAELEVTMKKRANELGSSKAELQDLEASQEKLARRTAELEAEIPVCEASLENLPKEIEAMTGKVEELDKQVKSLKDELGPEGEQLDTLLVAAQVQKEEISKLKIKRLQQQRDSDFANTEVYKLVREKRELEAEVTRLEEGQHAAQAELSELTAAMPKILIQRNQLFKEVETTVEEARVTREELLKSAERTQATIKEASLDKALAKEEAAFQSTALEISSTAKKASDNIRGAQAAFETAAQLRTDAEKDFVALQEAMSRRLEVMRAQEEVIGAALAVQQECEAQVQGMIKKATEQSKRFQSTNHSMESFSHNIEKFSATPKKNDLLPKKVERGDSDVVGVAVGLFASLMRAGAAAAQHASSGANKDQSSER